jgi:hypothetical protein
VSVARAAARACSRCATPLEDGDLRCAICALPVPLAAQPVERARSQILRCTECGAAIAFDANKQAPACGFCGAVMKVEQPIDPVEVAATRVPFAVGRAAAMAGLRSWLGSRGFFAPRSLRDEAVLETLHPLCWAAWVVDAQAAVSWTADSDAGARRSAWAPHAGVTSMTFDNIVVPASRGLTYAECAQLVPHYDLAALAPIHAAAGLVAEEPVIESFDAQRSAARQQVNAAIEATALHRVRGVIPGSKFRNIRVSCLLERQTTGRAALPAWVLVYRYRGSPYRAVVHGQVPGVVFGTSPTDWMKVLLVVGAVAAAVTALIAIIIASSG